jgi:hypothetical protein
MSLPNLFKAKLRLPTHEVNLKVENGRIYLFKYNERTCDFAVFSHSEQTEASDYILDPLPTVYYEVTVT